MSWWNSKQIVIDANVAAGSSNDRMFNPILGDGGAQNRQCLQAIWEERHIAVFSRNLRDEWDKHASSYAKRWLRNMEQKTRTIEEDGEQFAKMAGPVCACLSDAGERAALAKDFHLIQSALTTGQLILSNEVRFPRYVALACASVPELASLHYANPAVEGDQCRLWIKAGAEKDADRRIDVWLENHLKSQT
jgi:hypothetical protein